MDQIKTILLHIQQRLSKQVPELAYVDKDWGQLSYETPPVKWPCALLDIRAVDYTQLGRGHQMADTQVTVTVANMHPAASSPAAPKQEDIYQVIELLDEIHQALHLYTEGGYTPLFRTNLKKLSTADSSRECYEMTYQTAYETGFNAEEKFTEVPNVKVDIQ